MNPILKMGVLNITPNSFSDPGKNLNQKSLSQSIDNFLANNFAVLDFGAESTAPFNDEISKKTELDRLEPLLDILKDKRISLKNTMLSIDTYKPEIAFWFLENMRSLGFDNVLLWNDVSGVIDESVISWMKEEEAQYVFCSTHVPDRSSVQKHMNFCQDSHAVRENFALALDKGSRYKDKLWLDPAFGFSKSFEQNIELLKTFDQLVDDFDHQQFLIGVSRKSFFRKLAGENSSLDSVETMNFKTEFFQSVFLQKFMPLRSSNKFIFRVHDNIAMSILEELND